MAQNYIIYAEQQMKLMKLYAKVIYLGCKMPFIPDTYPTTLTYAFQRVSSQIKYGYSS